MLKIMKFKKFFIYFLLGIILLIHTLILTKLIFFPYPELFIYPYLTNHGLKPYTQILDQHFPGPMFLPINLDNLGMNSPETARLWSISIVIIIHIMLFSIGSKILQSRIRAILVNILFLIWHPFFEGWVLWIDSFLPIILLPAFYFLFQGIKEGRGDRGIWFFWSGLFLGLGIVFKQVLIPLAVLTVIYIVWKKRNFQIPAIFLFGFLIIPGLMLIYFGSIGVLRDFWYWTVVFNLTTYAQLGRGTGPTLAHFFRVFFVFGLPFVVIHKIKSTEVQIILFFLIGTLIGLSTRFDFVHFQPALPFAVLATIYGFWSLGRLGRLGRLGVLSLYGLMTVWWLIIFYKGHVGELVLSFDSDTKNLAAKIREYTDPGEKIFIFGAAPHLYQMSKTLPAGDIFVFQFPWFLKIAEEKVLEGIRKEQPNIVISDRSVIIEGAKITDYAEGLDNYINQNYQKIDSIGTTDILRRNSRI